MRALNEGETAWLLEVAMGTRLYVPVLLAVTSGMRRGEFLGLRWSDIDLANGTAAIKRSVEQTNSGLQFKSPKARKGRLIAPLPLTVDVLRAHRAEQEKQKQQLAESYQDDGLVCAREDGSLWKPDTFTADFARLAKKAGLKIRLHGLRTATQHSS